jgi:hypothetical protein
MTSSLIGKTYGNLRVLSVFEKVKSASGSQHLRVTVRYMCCGSVGVVRDATVYRFGRNTTTKCINCAGRERRHDYIGERFGTWTVLRDPGIRGPGLKLFCRCDCGKESWVWYSNLSCGLSTGCNDCRKIKQFKYIVGTRVGKNKVVARDGSRCKVACTNCGYTRWRRHIFKRATGCPKCMWHPVDRYGHQMTVAGETHNVAGWAQKAGITREAMRLRLLKGESPRTALVREKTIYVKVSPRRSRIATARSGR